MTTPTNKKKLFQQNLQFLTVRYKIFGDCVVYNNKSENAHTLAYAYTQAIYTASDAANIGINNSTVHGQFDRVVSVCVCSVYALNVCFGYFCVQARILYTKPF